MNKLTKVGLSALCGSLAAVSSANAGDMTVTGGVDMSWVTLDGGSSTTGNPIGMGSNLTFKGSGELDNGWTFDYTVAQNEPLLMQCQEKWVHYFLVFQRCSHVWMQNHKPWFGQTVNGPSVQHGQSSTPHASRFRSSSSA